MTTRNGPIDYLLTLTATEASTGFFACVPNPQTDLDTAVRYLRSRPMDTFMYRHILNRMGQCTKNQIDAMWHDESSDNRVIRALVLEAATLFPHLADFKHKADPALLNTLAAASPLVTLRARTAADHSLHQEWTRILSANLSRHKALPRPENASVPFPYLPEDIADPGGVHISRLPAGDTVQSKVTAPRKPPEETAALALERLNALGLLEGVEMRHESSLSPIGLLHQWRLSLQVNCGRHRYGLSGLQTAYGRGLTLPAARASYAMEIVERCSSFASIGGQHIRGCLQDHVITHGRHSALSRGSVEPVDPNDFGCDVPYSNEPLHWIKGIRRSPEKDTTVWVPVQSVFLFSNLDEIDLYAGNGSTGLASGNTLAEAKLSGLLELIERDGEATHPFHPSLCFHVAARDPKIQALFDDYRSRGIGFQFQDISPPYGVPCCKCFVTETNGRIAKGAAASLDGRRAVISALTETPYPYPNGPPSGPSMERLPTLLFEDLADYSADHANRDLARVEALLMANGINPIYVDITRKDLQFPVVRALLPGFALTADLDMSARVHPRLFANYLDLFKST